MLIDGFWRTIFNIYFDSASSSCQKDTFRSIWHAGSTCPCWRLGLASSHRNGTCGWNQADFHRQLAKVWWSMRKGWRFQRANHFTLNSKPTGRGELMKTSTLPQPQSLSESKEATETERRNHVDSSSRPSRPLSVEDTFVAKLDKAKDKELWRTLRLLSYKQFLTWTPRFLSRRWRFVLQMSERLNFHGVMEPGLDAIRSPTCTLSLIPPAFSRPGMSGETFCQDSRALNFCKASQPHLGIPLVPRVKQTLSYFHFPRMILSHCLREHPRKTWLPKSLWMTT